MKLASRWVSLVVAFAIGIGGVGYGINAAINQADEAQDALVARCESGNELREGLRAEKNNEIKFVESLPRLFEEAGVPQEYIEPYVVSQVKLIEHNRDTVFKEKQC